MAGSRHAPASCPGWQSVVSLGAGASVGQYGPLAHLGATLGSLVARVGRDSRVDGDGRGGLRRPRPRYRPRSTPPIAGIVFAHEVILRHYSLRAFAPITVAATMGYVVANVVFERPPLFRVEAITVSSAPEFLGFILIGVGGAFVAVLYMRAIPLLEPNRRKRCPSRTTSSRCWREPSWGWPRSGCPTSSASARRRCASRSSTTRSPPVSWRSSSSPRFWRPRLCIGFGFAGGVFSPALLIGILFGALAGNGAELVLGDLRSDVAIYAICGMVAVTSAVIGAPLTTILIVFELTRNYDLATAAMVSVVFSNLVSYLDIRPAPCSTCSFECGASISPVAATRAMLDHRLIESCVTRDYTGLAPETPLGEAKSRLLAAGRHEGYVIAAGGVYLGTVRLDELVACVDGDDSESGIPVARLARREALIFTASTSVWAAMEQMGDFVGESIPVLEDEDGGRMLGVVFEATIVKAYLDTVNDIRREENAGA